jgi:hypothetical protein
MIGTLARFAGVATQACAMRRTRHFVSILGSLAKKLCLDGDQFGNEWPP